MNGCGAIARLGSARQVVGLAACGFGGRVTVLAGVTGSGRERPRDVPWGASGRDLGRSRGSPSREVGIVAGCLTE
jgi:hypothetical protein